MDLALNNLPRLICHKPYQMILFSKGSLPLYQGYSQEIRLVDKVKNSLFVFYPGTSIIYFEELFEGQYTSHFVF